MVHIVYWTDCRSDGYIQLLIVCGLFIRSLYSPLVESLAGTQRSLSPDMNSFSKSKDAGAWNTSLLTTTSTEHYEQSGAVTFQVEDEGKNSLLAPQDPLPHGEKLSGQWLFKFIKLSITRMQITSGN